MLRLVFSLMLAATPLAAQPITVEGTFGANVEDGTAGGFADATASLALTPRLGFDVGVFGRPLSATHETYVTLTWSVAGGRVSGGIPRPAYDLYGVSVLDRVLPAASMRDAQVAATRSRATIAAVQGGDVQVGVLYRADGGWAASAHQVLDRDLTVGSLGGGLRLGAWDVEAAVDLASDGRRGAKLTAAREFGQVGAQVGGFASPEKGRRMLEAGLSWHATRRLDVSALTQIRMGDGDEKLAAVAMRYEMPRGAVHVGLISDDGEPTASMAFGMKF
jgi:hypothetical protein